jgi:hypothetical protein
MKSEAVITVKMLLMMSDNIARNMYSSQGKWNNKLSYTVASYWSFYKKCIMVHETMNVKFKTVVTDVCARILWELAADPLRSAEGSLGTTAVM